MQTQQPFQATDLEHLTLAANQTLDLELNLETMAKALSQLPGVRALALWAPAGEGAARLRLSHGAGAPILLWEKSHALRKDFGRRPFLLDDSAKASYASLGLGGKSSVVFDLGNGYFCGLGLGLAHDGAAGAAVKSLRPAIAAWVTALKACNARQALRDARAGARTATRALRSTRTQLEQAEMDFKELFENAIEGIFRTTPDGRYLRVNPALARMYGFEGPQHMLKELTDISRQLYVDPGQRGRFVQLMEQSDTLADFESQVRRADGTVIWISENVRAVRDGRGKLLFYEGMVINISKRKAAETKLMHAALHDELTGLPNRHLFLDRLAHAAGTASRHPDALYAVLFLDLDRFKLVNDSLGHAVGDALLIEVAERLQGSLRPGDTVARLGGDEFAMLLEELKDPADAHRVAARILYSLDQPVKLGPHELSLAASIGLAFHRPGLNSPEDLLRDADTAMYRAKSEGGDRAEIFDLGMHQQALQRLELERDLRKGLLKQEFEPWYQPIVRLDGQGLAGFEALARWRHPSRGLISPNVFIPIAEETGLIEPLGALILDRSLAQWRQWEDAGLGGLFLSVNLSAKQLESPDLAAEVKAALQRHRVPAGALKLEVTESLLVRDPAKAEQRLHELKALGVKLSMDDFGTGYSSLSMLHRFPLDTLKADRSFVMRIQEDGSQLEMLRAIVSLAHSLKMDVVAEGIEKGWQGKHLQSLGCEYGQGYLYAKPLSAEEATKHLGMRKAA
jgi:diguanylate cyclase (GGDEF)-like protein/PAS domain S-box-containing protein